MSREGIIQEYAERTGKKGDIFWMTVVYPIELVDSWGKIRKVESRRLKRLPQGNENRRSRNRRNYSWRSEYYFFLVIWNTPL